MRLNFIEKKYAEGVVLKGYIYSASPEIPQHDKRPAVVVLPGGGYCFCSDREAEPIATHFLGKGFNVFVFTYSLNEKAVFPRPLVELSIAIKDIRENADEWNIEKDKISVIGFSAGGHLAASLATLWNYPEVVEKSGCRNGENKPNAVMLGYPVINTHSWMANEVSRLAGDRDIDQAVSLLDTDKNVGPHTPPTFIFHTYSDNCVAVEDSLAFSNALAKNNIPFEMHIFTAGVHGLATCDDRTTMCDTSAVAWMDMASTWLWRVFGRADLNKFDLNPERAHTVEDK